MLITAFVAGAAVFLMMLFFAYMLLPRVGRGVGIRAEKWC